MRTLAGFASREQGAIVSRGRLLAQVGVLGVVVALFAACATPIGVTRGTRQEMQREMTASVLSTGEPSDWALLVLRRQGLVEEFEKAPDETLAKLREGLTQRVSSDRLFALAELWFRRAEQTGKHEHYLAAAAYAYAFLVPGGDDRVQTPKPLDPRLRLAADLYNLGIAAGLASPDGQEVVLAARTLALPFGEMELTLDPSELEWSGYRFSRFIPVGEYFVRGLRNRYRQAGIGAPLAAELAPVGTGPAAETARRRIPPRLRVPVTAFVRLEQPLQGILEGRLRGRIELYSPDEASSVTVDGREVPLQFEPTAALALMLEGAPVWDFELAGFRFSEQPVLGDGLIMLHPYRPGRIPVVLVHGTASSPARWAEMVNELSNDRIIGARYQFWLFMYNTGQPILLSALKLRQALAAVVSDLDPEGKDPALRRMLVIGHSQGGLLAKLMVISSGSRFWDNLSKVPMDQLEMNPETRRLFQGAMFFEPVPTVERVVFIATPHRGSYRAGGWVLNLVRRIVRLPGTLASEVHNVVVRHADAFTHPSLARMPTSVDNMSPSHHFIRTLGSTPIDPHVTAHSIVAVLGSGPLSSRTDGVVAYESAHIDGVASELVVRSGHSVQAQPAAIEEVRRILRVHAGER